MDELSENRGKEKKARGLGACVSPLQRVYATITRFFFPINKYFQRNSKVLRKILMPVIF